MKQLSPEETFIEGKWVNVGNKIESDDSCKRIEWLASEKLKLIGTNGDNWEALYQDPIDSRYWVMFYPKSELHGGGPPSLKLSTDKDINLKFNEK